MQSKSKEQGISLFFTLVILLVTSSMVLLAFRGSITHTQLGHTHAQHIKAHQLAERGLLEVVDKINDQVQRRDWVGDCPQGDEIGLCFKNELYADKRLFKLPALQNPDDFAAFDWIAFGKEQQRLGRKDLSIELRAYPAESDLFTKLNNNEISPFIFDASIVSGISIMVSKRYQPECVDIINDAIERDQREGLVGGLLNTLIPGSGSIASLDSIDQIRVLVGSLAQAELLAGMREVDDLIAMLSAGDLSLNPDLQLDADILQLLQLNACVAAGIALNEDGIQLDVDASIFAGLNIPILGPLLDGLLGDVLSPLEKILGRVNLLGNDRLLTLELSLLSDLTVLDPLIQRLPLLNQLGISQEGTGLVAQLLSDGTFLGDTLALLGIKIEDSPTQMPSLVLRQWQDINTSLLERPSE